HIAAASDRARLRCVHLLAVPRQGSRRRKLSLRRRRPLHRPAKTDEWQNALHRAWKRARHLGHQVGKLCPERRWRRTGVVAGRPQEEAAVSAKIRRAGPGTAVRRPRKIYVRPARSSECYQRRDPRITAQIYERPAGTALKNISVELSFCARRLHDPEVDTDDPG